MPQRAGSEELPLARSKAPSDTLFGSLQRAHERVTSGRRALAGLRNGDEWVELTYDELMADILTVSRASPSWAWDRGMSSVSSCQTGQRE